MFAIAEHKPDILYDKNKKILGQMSKSQMHDFAATKGLKKKASPKKFVPKPTVVITPNGYGTVK